VRGESSFDRDRAIGLLLELLNIPGPPGQERQVIDYIIGRLREAGLSDELIKIDEAHKRSRHGGEVGNLIVRLPGSRRLARRLLMAHVDTVPLCVGCRPVIRGNYVVNTNRDTALGADNRSGTAVLLHTLLWLLERGVSHPPLTFLWTVQEEVGLRGARHVHLKDLGRPRLAFNWDGSEPDSLTIGATGAYRIEIELHGLASHAGIAPERGVSAVAAAALAIAELHEQGWHGRITRGRHSGTSNVGVIEGGAATNVVADRVRLRAEVRSHDPRFRERILAAYQRAFDRAAKRVRNNEGRSAKVKFDYWHDYESFRLKENSPVVVAATEAVSAVGLTPKFKVADGGLDANWLTANGMPTVTLGAGQRDPHTVRERLHLPSFLRACQIALVLATGSTDQAGNGR